MKKREKNLLKDRILVIVIFLVIAVLAVAFLFILASSKRIKECKNRLHTLGSGAHVISAEYDDVKVVLSEENRAQLISLLGYAQVWAFTEDVETTEEIHFTFDGDKMWDLYIDLIDDEYVKIVIKGEEEYVMLSDNNGRFEKYRMLASPEGWRTENRVIK